jgi:hypothetical protein
VRPCKVEDMREGLDSAMRKGRKNMQGIHLDCLIWAILSPKRYGEDKKLLKSFKLCDISALKAGQKPIPTTSQQMVLHLLLRFLQKPQQ